MFFRVWTEECLTSVRTFCQRWQPWIPCAQETNMNHRFFSEKFVIFYSSLYSEGKLCCFWRKLFGRFEFPEENLEKNMLGEVFFISNLLENQQLFYSVLEKKFHQFRQLCILRLQWTIWGRKSFWKKKQLFLLFWTLGGNVCGLLQNVSHRLLELRFKRPEKHFQRENQKNESIVLILWIMSEMYLPTLKIRQSCQVFILLARMKNFKRKIFESKV